MKPARRAAENVAMDPVQCNGEPGRVAPVIDRNRCEGKAECVRVCPYGVFELGVLEPAQRAPLSWLGRLKGWAHGYQQALVVKLTDCHACGLCVEKGYNRLAVGLAMVPRGEVGLIFADAGLRLVTNGEPLLTSADYSAIVLMVLATTMVTPPLLGWALKRNGNRPSATAGTGP